MSFLRIEGLCIQIGKRQLVRNLDWEVDRGQLWCVLGKNGIGKTSLLYTIAGLLPPGAGKVLIEDCDIASMPAAELARKRGMLMQDQIDAFSHRVIDTVLISRTPYRMGRSWDSESDLAISSAALQAVGLQHKSDSDVLHLSGGERQRVALAALLAQAPNLMLLDEPTSHQDVAQQLAVMRLVKKLSEAHAVIVNCHDIQLASRFATHVLLLAPDRFWQGPVAEVLKTPALERAFDCRFEVVSDPRGNRFTAY
jgi:iron complex transport system ATP-binding protein